MGCSAAIAMRYVVMSHDAAATSVPASRVMAGSATTSIVELSGTSALPIATDRISFGSREVMLGGRPHESLTPEDREAEREHIVRVREVSPSASRCDADDGARCCVEVKLTRDAVTFP